MRILVVSHYFWPENFRINDLALVLKSRGHDVSVLTGMPNYPSGKLFAGYGWWQKRFDDMDGVPIYRVPLFLRRQGRGWQLALNYFSFVIFGCLLAPWYFRNHAFDVVFVYEPSPFTVGIPGVLMRWLKRAPMLFWVQDLWPESLTAAGAVHSPVILRMVGKLVRWIYRHCDRVLVQSEAFVEPAIKAGADRKRIGYLPNWAESFYRPMDSGADALSSLGVPEGFRILFAGNLGEAQALETILAAAERLAHQAEVHWVMVGDGRRAEWMQQEASRLGVDSTIHFLGAHPAQSMPQFFACADLLLVTLKDDVVFAHTVPSKVQTYMACGRPILAALNGEGARVIRHADAGIAVAAGDAEALARAAEELFHMSAERRDEMGRKARRYYEHAFEREMLVARLEQWMHEAVKRGVLCES
ncbi:MAG: glycosyltransferase family 4 protein [Mariprofundales bacterium]